VSQEPDFPRKGSRIKESVHELHKEAVVLIRQIFDPKATTIFAAAHLVPGKKAFGTMTFVLTRPQKGPPPSIKDLNNSFWKEE